MPLPSALNKSFIYDGGSSGGSKAQREKLQGVTCGSQKALFVTF